MNNIITLKQLSATSCKRISTVILCLKRYGIFIPRDVRNLIYQFLKAVDTVPVACICREGLAEQCFLCGKLDDRGSICKSCYDIENNSHDNANCSICHRRFIDKQKSYGTVLCGSYVSSNNDFLILFNGNPKPKALPFTCKELKIVHKLIETLHKQKCDNDIVIVQYYHNDNFWNRIMPLDFHNLYPFYYTRQ